MAIQTESNVDHPIIDRIRGCSSTPNDAVDFFTHLFHPCPCHRLTTTAALHHPYLAACLRQMRHDVHATNQLPLNLNTDAYAIRRKGVLHLPRALGRQLRLSQAFGMVKHIAGSAARPITKPLSCIMRRPGRRSGSDLSPCFPHYTHRPQDHELPDVARPEEMDNHIRVYTGLRRTAEGCLAHTWIAYPSLSDVPPTLRTGYSAAAAVPQICSAPSQAVQCHNPPLHRQQDAQGPIMVASNVHIEEVDAPGSQADSSSLPKQLVSHPIECSDDEDSWQEIGSLDSAESLQDTESHWRLSYDECMVDAENLEDAEFLEDAQSLSGAESLERAESLEGPDSLEGVVSLEDMLYWAMKDAEPWEDAVSLVLEDSDSSQDAESAMSEAGGEEAAAEAAGPTTPAHSPTAPGHSPTAAAHSPTAAACSPTAAFHSDTAAPEAVNADNKFVPFKLIQACLDH